MGYTALLVTSFLVLLTSMWWLLPKLMGASEGTYILGLGIAALAAHYFAAKVMPDDD